MKSGLLVFKGILSLFVYLPGNWKGIQLDVYAPWKRGIPVPFNMQSPVIRYLPTYRLESKKPLNREVCENIMKKAMEQVLEDYQYTSKYAQILCKNLSEEIKTRIKIHSFDRYKLICIVTIGEKYMQGYNSVVAFLWDAEKDGYITCVHDTPNYFVVATLYYCYYD